MSVLGDVLEATAPWLTTALTSGPVGIAAMAAEKLAGVFGLSDTSAAGVAGQLTNLTLTGDQKVQLQQAEYNYQLQMKQMGFTAEAQMAADEAGTLAAINKTMQTEETSTNAFAADWRPMWGYVSAAVFAFVSVSACIMEFKAVFSHDAAAQVAVSAMIGAFVPLFGIAGAVLGINAWHAGTADVASVLPLKE